MSAYKLHGNNLTGTMNGFFTVEELVREGLIFAEAGFSALISAPVAGRFE